MSISRELSTSILREYDIRGIVGDTITESDVEAIGRAFGSLVAENSDMNTRVAVGYDGRLSSPSLSNALTFGLASAGVDVSNIGLGPTPMLYFATYELETSAGVMITGSHNPPEFNGIKFMLQGRSFYGDQIKELGNRVSERRFSRGEGSITTYDVSDAYINRLLDCLSSTALDIKVAWDPGNGASGDIVRRLIARLDGEHLIINDEIDGTFPNHHPDPTVEENLTQLKSVVKQEGCDLGIGFDGDGDRIGVIDSQGRVLWGDQLMVIWSRDLLKRLPGSTIIADVKTSRVFFDEVERVGGIPLIWKTGHSLIKSKMLEMNAPLAGEMSGHIFFADEYYGFDDAIYASLRLLRILMREGQRIDSIRDQLPIMYNTPELRFDCPDNKKFLVIEEVKKRLSQDPNATVHSIDGVRVEADDGWWLLRASNTQPVLVARCESGTKKGLQRLKKILADQISASGMKVPDFE